jgi:hypothetical protein
MRLLLATHKLGRGGSESYLIAVASELQRLGHTVAIHAVEDGPGGERARALGVDVELGETPPNGDFDAALIQDAGRSYAIARHRPATAQVFVAHSELFDAQMPPQDGSIGTAVALSERVERRIRALAAPPPVVRMTQPIDSERFVARETIRARPRRAIALSNYLHGARLELLRRAWEPAGVEVVAIGEEGEPTDAPELAIADADVVVAKGRALLEGMASSRACYAFDMAGCDGWVTRDSYPAMEADGFAGQATRRFPTVEALRADLDLYRAEMGTANRDLVTAHHGVRRHAERLVELLAGARLHREDGDPAALGELQRLARAQWRVEDRAASLSRENDRLHSRIVEIDADREQLRARALELQGERDTWQSHAENLEHDGRQLRATRRYRLAGALGRPLDLWRGRRR